LVAAATDVSGARNIAFSGSKQVKGFIIAAKCSHGDAAKVHVVPEPVPIAAVVFSAAADARPRASANGRAHGDGFRTGTDTGVPSGLCPASEALSQS
jgi:hypothetical protein